MLGETLHLLADGFALALTPKMLLYSGAGAFLGTAIGVLPGIGSAGALALMLPIVVSLDPIGALIMLAATYTGVMYMAARPLPYSSIRPVTRLRSLPASTVTPWPSRAARDRRSALRQSAPTLPARSRLPD